MVKTFLSLLFLLLTSVVLAIYPFLDHPPIWLLENNLPTVDFEGTSLSSLIVKLRTSEDEFTLIDATSLHHRIHIPLKENFEYEIYQNGSLIGKGKIVYPSNDLNDFTILVYGDTRSDEKNIQEKIIEDGKNADFLIHLGDIAYFDFLDDGYRKMFNALYKFGKISFTVKGNHEIPGLRYSMYFYPSYYSFRIGSYRFFVLNGNDPFNILKLRTKWLFDEYKNEKTTWIVLIHKGIFDCGKYSNESGEGPSYELHEIFEKHNIKLVISSHDHNYQRLRFKNITYMIVGGGGAPLHSIKKDCKLLVVGKEAYSYVILKFKKNRILITAYDIDGNVIDNFTLSFE